MTLQTQLQKYLFIACIPVFAYAISVRINVISICASTSIAIIQSFICIFSLYGTKRKQKIETHHWEKDFAFVTL
jgi:uncharacterized membrane protein